MDNRSPIRFLPFAVGTLFLLFMLFVVNEFGLLLGWLSFGFVFLGAISILVLSRGGHPGRQHWIKVLLLATMLLVVWLVPWTSRKRFLGDFYKVRLGMSVAECESIMRGYMKGTGWPALPGSRSGGSLADLSSGSTFVTSVSANGELVLEGCIVYRHSNDGSYNSDWGVVKILDGKVVNVEFLPD